MNINGTEYVERSAFDELHRVNMALVDASRVTVHELARLRAIESAAAKAWATCDDEPQHRGAMANEWRHVAGSILRGELP